MQTSDTTSTFGSTLHYGDGLLADTPTYQQVDGVETITPPGLSVNSTELKWLDKATQTVGKKPNWKNGKDAAATIYYQKANMTTLYALVGVMRAWKVQLVDGSHATFDGFISDFTQPQKNGDGEEMILMTITVDDVPVWTPAA